jgi:AcrR family transcriptional regulator
MNEATPQSETRSATSSRRGASTREALIAAGRDAFARQGFDGATIRDITRAADANLGAVTYHFGSKRDLYAAVLADTLAPLRERVQRAAAAPGTPIERIEAAVRAFFEHLGATPEMPRLMLQEVSAGRPPPEAVATIMRGALTLLAQLVQDGQEDGSIRPGDPTLMSLSIIAQPVYLTLVRPLAALVFGIHSAEGTDRQRAIDHVLAFVRGGLQAGDHDR